MSSGAAVRRAGLLSGTVGAVAACTAALLLAPGALAAPYPPTQPCVVTAAQASHRAYVPRPGVVDVDVRGAGASAGDLVSLASAGRTLARVRADAQGGFAAVVTAPTRPDGTTPVVAAVTARERCVSNPPPGSPGDGDPTNGGPDGPDGPEGTDGGSDGTAGAGGPGSIGLAPGSPATGPSGPLSTDIAGTTGSTAPSAPSVPSGPATSASTSNGSGNPTGTGRTSAPPRADVPRGSGPSLGIGLAIAAALLVLGTLAVLLLTRRPEH